MKRTALASDGVASPPVVPAEKPKRKKRRSVYDRTEREGDEEKAVVQQPPKPLARFGSRALKVITNAFKTTFGKKASKIQHSDKENEKAFRFGRKRLVLDGFIVLDGVWRNFQKCGIGRFAKGGISNLGRTAIAFIPTVYELSRCVRCARFQAIEFDELKDFERNVQGLQRNNQILLR